MFMNSRIYIKTCIIYNYPYLFIEFTAYILLNS